jgi:hypothetical protein
MNYNTYQSNLPTSTNSFAEDVLNVIIKNGGKDSMSSIKSALTSMGWKRLGGTVDFQNKLEEEGFILEHEYSKRNPNAVTRTYVTA